MSLCRLYSPRGRPSRDQLGGYYNSTENFLRLQHHSNALRHLTMLRGKHTIKFGGDARNYRNFHSTSVVSRRVRSPS